jgi:hypothetical protein
VVARWDRGDRCAPALARRGGLVILPGPRCASCPGAHRGPRFGRNDDG